MSNTITLNSNAKVNLALRITGKNEEGYHTLSTLFQEIDISDEITIKKTDNFEFESNNDNIPVEDNTCVKAYNLMKEFSDDDKECAIYLDKNIPIGAGLGGGSSNAASILKFLNEYWSIGFSTDELKKVGRKIGADVPFFIEGKTQIGEGIGEKLSSINIKEDFKLVCIVPDYRISTKWAYSNFNLTKKEKKFNFDSLILEGIPKWELFENQFEEIVSRTYPETGEIKEKLLSIGAKYAGLSGSGSTVFGIFDSGFELSKNIFPSKSYKQIVASPVL